MAPKRILIRPYSMKSASAILLKGALGAQFILKENSKYVPRYDDLVINWGCGYLPSYLPARVVNSPLSVSKAVNKTSTLRACKDAGVQTVEWTQDQSIAKGWLNTGHKVVVRGSTTSSGGKGIQIVDPSQNLLGSLPAAVYNSGYQATLDWLKGLLGPSKAQETPIQLPYAPLYTKYVDKEGEFRVHVGGGQAIHTQMKLRKDGTEPKEVWNHDNGYTFTSKLDGRIDPSILSMVTNEGVKAVAALGLDFGAVDIAWSNSVPLVLEVNTAPGIEEPTLSKYVSYIRGINV